MQQYTHTQIYTHKYIGAYIYIFTLTYIHTSNPLDFYEPYRVVGLYVSNMTRVTVWYLRLYVTPNIPNWNHVLPFLWLPSNAYVLHTYIYILKKIIKLKNARTYLATMSYRHHGVKPINTLFLENQTNGSKGSRL